MAAQSEQYTSFRDFYPYYLSEHSDPTNRVLHFVGTSLGALFLITSIVTMSPLFLLLGVLQGYAWAWVGHFFFERNKPATFKYPLWSFMGDWKMWFELLTRQRSFNPRASARRH